MGKTKRCRKIRSANKRLKKQAEFFSNFAVFQELLHQSAIQAMKMQRMPPAPFATGGIIAAKELQETVLSKEDLLKDREIEPNVFHFKGETLVKDCHYNLIVFKIKEINEQGE